tara:strand:+ start:790 stop:3948 length:3159 start_codon:yes stop_codon:yes gene_type:complete
MPTVEFTFGGQKYKIEAGPKFLALSEEERKKKLRAFAIEKQSGSEPDTADATAVATPTTSAAAPTTTTARPSGERMDRNDALWFATKMGLSDTARGIGQLIPGDVGEEWMAEQQSKLNDLMDDEEYGTAVTGAYFGGMIADPVSWALPIGKVFQGAKMGWKGLTKLGALSGGVFGGLGYVDPEAPSLVGTMTGEGGQMTRGEQAMIGVGAGSVLSPLLGKGIQKLGDAKAGDVVWKALSTRPEAGGAAVGALAGYNTDMDAPMYEKMKNAAIWAAAGAVGGAGIKQIDKASGNALARFFIPDWNLDEAYIASRGRFSGDRSVIRQEFETVLEKMAELPEAGRKALYRMLTDPDATEDAALVGLKGETRELVTKYGKELRDLGVLDPDTFLKNVDTYLHRTYRRPKAEKFFSTDQMVRTIGDELRMRGVKKNWTKADWEKGLRPDTDGEWEIVGKGLRGDEVKIRRDFSAAERAEMNEVTDAAQALNRTGILMANDVSAYRFFRDMANNPKIASSPEVPEADRLARGHTWEIPEARVGGGGKKSAKKFGDLAGKFVSRETYDDLVRVAQLKDKSGVGWKIFNKYKKLNAAWKVTKTALNPAVHMNNIISNVHLYDFYDGSVRNLAKAAGDMRSKNKIYQEALQNGVFGADFIGHEISPAFKMVTDAYKTSTGGTDALGWAEKWAPKIAMKIARGAKAKTIDKMMKAYMMEDHVFRMGLYRTVKDRLIKQGLTESEAIAKAARDAREGFVDYSKTTPALEMLRHGPLPFISYMYGVIPRLAETAAKKPLKLAKWGMIWHGLNQAGEHMSDMSEEEIEYQRRQMAPYQRRTMLGMPGMAPAAIKMPDFMSPKTKDDWYLDVGRMIPGGDIFGMTEGGVGQIPGLPQALQPSFGAAGAIYDAFTGIDRFKGKERMRGPTTQDKLLESAQYLGKQFIPNLPVPTGLIPGVPDLTYSGAKLTRAIRGGSQPSKDYHTTASALMSSFGVKTTPVSTKKGIQRKRMKHEQDMRKIEQQMQAAGRAVVSKDLTRVEYSNLIKKLNEQRKKLAKEFSRQVKR